MRIGSIISVVVPVFNEELCIEEFYSRTVGAVESIGVDFELVFVDDGSKDSSFSILEHISKMDSRAKVITFSRNFGHQSAVTAGLDYCIGDAVVVIDSDLQDQPELIPDLYAKWQLGADVVHAERIKRHGESLFRKFCYKIFYRTLKKIADVPVQLDSGDFRLYDRKVVQTLCSMTERTRVIRGMVAWAGFKQDAIQYERDARFAGESKYSYRKLIRLAIDTVTSLSYLPLQFAGLVGFLTFVAAIIFAPIILILRIIGVSGLSGQTTVIEIFLFFSGLNLLVLGIIGEYLGRLYLEAKNRPSYVVMSTIGFEKK